MSQRCFNPLPSCEGRPVFASVILNKLLLQSTSLLRGKTGTCPVHQPSFHASIHFPLAREDAPASQQKSFQAPLQSTSLLRGNDKHPVVPDPFWNGFNPLPSCEGRLQSIPTIVENIPASIHFPLAREDSPSKHQIGIVISFNPLPSCEGRLQLQAAFSLSKKASIHFPLARGRLFDADNDNTFVKLQSTSLLRGKTWRAGKRHRRRTGFNPLPSCEEDHHH